MGHLINPVLLKKFTRSKQNLLIVDVRWYSNATLQGRKEWETSRIPGAIFLDLDNDLSDQSSKTSGRHPLPDPFLLANTLAAKGIGKDSFIVAYDDAAGAIAARFWWMMRWIKGPETKILDGGFQSWKTLGLPVESGPEKNSANIAGNPIVPVPQNQMLVNKPDLSKALKSGDIILLDARDEDRFLGKYEPIDPVAGHIPGALNSPFKQNLTQEVIPVFQTGERLRSHYEALGINSGEKIVCYCGSGVTACHNILAMEIAGFTGAKLYPGSWSEWCQDLISEKNNSLQ